MKARKIWREKMDAPNLPKLVAVPAGMEKSVGNGIMLVPSPREVEAVMRTAPVGSVLTVSQIRRVLAARYSADVTCPLTTGIFVRIAAEVAEVDDAEGRTPVTPYWRVVKDDGSLNAKFPGGVERQVERLRSEGHRIVAGVGKRPPRVDFDRWKS